MPTRTSPVDITDSSTWPPELAERVRELAEELVGSTDCMSDLALEQHDEEFRTLLEGHLVRASHCTWLLKHEAADIRADGLWNLTSGLVTALLDLSDLRPHNTASTLARLDVGTGLGLADAHGGLNHKASIPPDRIEQLAHPGDPSYDRHTELPQT